MARIGVNGFELVTAEFDDAVATGSAAGRLPGGLAFQMANGLSTSGARNTAISLITTKNHFWCRFYLRVRAYAGAGGRRLVGFSGSIEGTDEAAYLNLESDGTLRAYNKGNGVKTQVGQITTALTLGQWYRVNLEIQFRVAGAAIFNLQLDGDPILAGNNAKNFTGTGFGTTNGLGHLTQLCSQIRVGHRVGALECDGGDLDLDDLVADDAAAPGAGGVTLLHVNGQGTYNDWTAGGDFRSVIRRLPDNINTSAPMSITNSTVNAKTSFTLESIASKVGAAVTVKSVRLLAYGNLPRASWFFILRQNGVDTNAAAQIADNGVNWKTMGGTTPGKGWLIDRSTLAIAPADTLEIGLADGPSGAGVAGLSGMYLVVDWEGTDPTPAAESQAIVIKYGSYVGNASTQDVAFDDATFEPTFLLVLNNANVVTGRALWTRGFGYAGDFAQAANGQSNGNSGLCRVYKGGFSVKGAAGIGLNDSGSTYRYLAIRDVGGRMIDTGHRTVNWQDDAVDNINVPLVSATFPLEALIVAGQRWGNASGTANICYRDTTYVGDASSTLDIDAAAAADQIQSMGTGTFQLGATRLSKTPAFDTVWVGFRATNVFNAKRMLAIGSYTGDGASPRDIPFGLDTNPAIVLVIPENANARAYRFYNDGGGTSSRSFVDGSNLTTAVTAFSTPGKFTVGAALNTNAAVFHFLVFGAGTDPAEVLLPEGGIGLTWVEFTDKAGGLHLWSKVALPDPATYFGGYKEDRVLSWGKISRALSDREGQFEGADFSFTVSDTDRYIRGLLDNEFTKYFPNRPIVVRMIDDPSRRLQRQPRTVVRGLVSTYQPLSPLHFSFKAEDVLTRKFSDTRNVSEHIPRRRIAVADFPNAPTATIGLGVPIIYGAASDRVLVPTQVSSALVFDPTIPPITQAGQLDIGPASPPAFSGAIGTFVTAIIAGKEGPGAAAGTFVAAPYLRAVGIYFNRVTGADSYRAYCYDGPGPFDPRNPKANGGTFVRMKTHDNSTIDGYWNGNFSQYFRDFSIIFNGPTDGVDALNSFIWVNVDSGKGVVPPIYVGDQTIGGTLYRKFLLAGHACKSIEEIYVDNLPQNLQTDASAGGVGGTWLVPGYAGWTAQFGAAKYEDVNGNRYTVVYGKAGLTGPDRGAGVASAPVGASGNATSTAPLMFNVQGIEDVGDGTGALITDLLKQYKHAIINWILQSYASGAWLTAPTFDDTEGVAQIDEASFDTASAAAATRISSGYVGAMVIGVNGEITAVRDVVARFNQSADVDSGFNRKAQFFVSMFSESVASQNSAIALTDAADIFTESFELLDDLDSHFNSMPYVYAQDYAGLVQSGWIGTATLQNAASIANYGATLVAPELKLFFVRDVATAQDVVARRMLRMKDPPRIARWEMGLSGMNYDLGEILNLTHFQGISLTGWHGQPLRIIRHDADPDKFTVRLECMDLKALFQAAFILGDETALAATWPAATTANRIYGYLADETTGKFSTGDSGKRLR